MSEINPEIIDDIVVVKAGTSILSYNTVLGKELLDPRAFKNIGEEVVSLSDENLHPIVVTSASIAGGLAFTDLKERPESIPELQRLSSLGHRHLMNYWDRALPNKITGSLLITEHELADEGEREELLIVLHTMLGQGDIPVINENDAITHKEITFGDNDILAARLVGRIASSERFGDNISLVLLTDRVGLCEDPSDPTTLISQVDNVNDVMHLAGRAGPGSKGGMKSKLLAADILRSSGVDMYIADGTLPNVLERTFSGDTGTYFPAAIKN